MGEKAWTVTTTQDVREWLSRLARTDRRSFQQVVAAVRLLRQEGPALGRPMVDTITASKLANLKELRPGSSGRTELRILFAFDPFRQAILLVAGDKAGQWTKWYREAIPEAERRYAEHLAELEADR